MESHYVSLPTTVDGWQWDLPWPKCWLSFAGASDATQPARGEGTITSILPHPVTVPKAHPPESPRDSPAHPSGCVLPACAPSSPGFLISPGFLPCLWPLFSLAGSHPHQTSQWWRLSSSALPSTVLTVSCVGHPLEAPCPPEQPLFCRSTVWISPV